MMVKMLSLTVLILLLVIVQVEGRGINPRFKPRCAKCVNVASFAKCIKPALCYEVFGAPKHVVMARCERSRSIYFYPASSRHHAVIKTVDGETCSKFLIS